MKGRISEAYERKDLRRGIPMEIWRIDVKEERARFRD